MFAKKIKFTDFNGVEREETHYFNLTETECVELQLSAQGGVSEVLTNIIETQDNVGLGQWFKKLIAMSYGKKEANGGFYKKDPNGVPYFRDFEASQAYNVFFQELIHDDKKAAEYVNAMLPKDPNASSKPNVTPATIAMMNDR